MSEYLRTLKLPIFYPILGLFSLVLGLYIIISGIIHLGFVQILFGLLLLTLFFSGLGILLLLWGLVFKIKLTKDYIVHTSMFGKTKTIYYKDIKELSFGKKSLELKIKTNKTNVKAHSHLIGFSNLIEMIEKNTNLTCNTYGNRNM